MTTDSTPRTGEPPERFGRYRLLKKLGQGGMGVVYLAHDPDLNRLVALKTPLDAGSVEAVERFRRAARAAAPLHHPNICPLFEVGAIDGTPYLTMAYIDGTTLAERLRSGRMPAAEAAALVRTVALALAEAHDCGVIHCDVKPSNILINRRGEPILTDFGLARFGTPAYTPPEQRCGESEGHDPAGDVYSLGVVLCELLTGRLPSAGTPDLDQRLDAVFLRATARNPAERYPDMTAFAAALAPFCEPAQAARKDDSWSLPLSASGENRPSSERDKSAESPQRLSRRSWRLVAGAAVGCVIAAAGVYSYIQMGYLQTRVHPPPVFVAEATQDDSDSAEAYLHRARAHLDRNDMDEAIRDATEALRGKPDWAAALVVRGRAEYRQGMDGQACADFTEAHRSLEQGTDHPQTRARDYADQAWCFLRIDQRDEALADCAAAVRLDPSCTAAWLLSAQTWHDCGRRDRELETYADAWQTVKPDAAGQFADLAQAALALDRPDDALRACDEAVRRDPHLLEAFEGRARAWLRKGDRDRAAADFAHAAALMRPRWARDYLDRSILYELTGDPNRALADAGRAIALAPRLAAALRQRGTAHRAKQDRALAVADFREAAAVLAPRYSSDYFDRAWIYNELGDHAAATADLERALAHGLSAGEVHREMAHACRNLKEYERAGLHLDLALRLLPRDAMLFGECGALSFAQGRYDDAARAYSRLLTLTPDDAEAYASRGDAFFQSADYASAVEDYTRALRRTAVSDRAGRADIYDRRGVSFARLGKLAEASADYSRAIDNDPDDPVLYRNRAAARLRAGDDAAAEADLRKAEDLLGSRP